VEKVKEELLKFVELPRDLKTEARIIDTITTLIKDNLEQILDYVIDPEEWQEVFGEKSKASCIDNIQLLDIILTIYNNNFKAAQKKITKEMSGLMELFQKKEEHSQPDQLLQDSSEPTPNIPSEISLEKEDIEEE
jgi:lipoate-protein ligase A